jgi:hypothetical protein
MRFFTFFAWTLIGWVGLQTFNVGQATINDLQERRAEALCQVDNSYCGQSR